MKTRLAATRPIALAVPTDRECLEAPAATPAPSSPSPSDSPTDGTTPGATGADTVTSTAAANVDEDDGIAWTSGGSIAGCVVAGLRRRSPWEESLSCWRGEGAFRVGVGTPGCGGWE